MDYSEKPSLDIAEPSMDMAAEDDGTREPEETRMKESAAVTASSSTSDLESQLQQVRSHVSTHDVVDHEHRPRDRHFEEGDEIYDKFPAHRKTLIVAVLSFCAFLAPISSTSILAASPEVVATFDTTGAIFNVSNALYLVFMGLSPLFWGPMGQTYGRRWTLVASAVTFTGFSVGSALAPNLASYFVFRCLTA